MARRGRKIFFITAVSCLFASIIGMAGTEDYVDGDGEKWQAKVTVGPIYPGETVYPEYGYAKQTSDSTAGVTKTIGSSAYAPMIVKLKSTLEEKYTNSVTLNRSTGNYVKSYYGYVTTNNVGYGFKPFVQLSSTAYVSKATLSGYMTPKFKNRV